MSERLYPGKPFPVIGYASRDALEIFCPFCGFIHTHGSDREPFEGYHGPVIGCRVPHCWKHPVDEHGYDIVEAIPEPMPKELRTLAKSNERRLRKAYEKGKPYTPHWLAGWIAGWEPGTAPGPDWQPHSYVWCDIDPKWKHKTIEPKRRRKNGR